MSADWESVAGKLLEQASDYERNDISIEYAILINGPDGNHYQVTNILSLKEAKERVEMYLKDGTIKDGKYVILQRVWQTDYLISDYGGMDQILNGEYNRKTIKQIGTDELKQFLRDNFEETYKGWLEND